MRVPIIERSGWLRGDLAVAPACYRQGAEADRPRQSGRRSRKLRSACLRSGSSSCVVPIVADCEADAGFYSIRPRRARRTQAPAIPERYNALVAGNIYFELTRAFNAAGPIAVLASGQEIGRASCRERVCLAV